MFNSGMFGSQGGKPHPDLIYRDVGPPDYAAQYGTQVIDQNGIIWTQEFDGLSQYWVESGYAGSYTSILWSHGTWPQIPVSLTGPTVSGNVGAVAYNYGGAGVFSATDNTDYFTAFFLDRTVRVYGLLLPVRTGVNGTTVINVKASIYQCQITTHPGQPWKLANTNAQFSVNATMVNTADMFLVPYAPSISGSVEPIILTPGKYYIRHMWGERPNTANFAGRYLLDITGSNMYRMDRYRGTGNSLNFSTTTMDDVITIGTIPGSGQGDGTQAGMGPANINWAMWVEVLD